MDDQQAPRRTDGGEALKAEDASPRTFGRPAGDRAAGRSLYVYLVALVLAGILPMLAFSAAMVIRAAGFERDSTQRYLSDSTSALSLDVDRQITALQAVLTTLALSPQVNSGDFAGLHQTLSRAVPLPGAWFVLSERSGREVVNTRLPFGDTLPGRTEPETVDRVFVTEKPVVSNVFRARLTGQPVISLDVPVARDGAVTFTLALVLPPESFTQIMHDQHMPPSWIGAVFDRNGVTVARTHEAEKFVGAPGRADLVAALKEKAVGSLPNVTREGVPVYNSFFRSDLTGWSVAIGAPQADLDAPLWRSLGWTLVGGTLLLALGGALAVAAGRRITRPVVALAASAAAVGRGERPVELDTNIKEFQDVAGALSAAEEQLRLRATQRREAQELLHRLNETLEQRVAAEIKERMTAEEALRQAQKMEAIGRLTGGVAHDFNNLLQVIIANVDAVRRQAVDGPIRPEELRQFSDAAMRGAERGATLTKRLLAFSRRQPLQPKSIEVNKLVTGMSDLLRRTLGESITIETVLGGGLWPISADANQLESALLNLAVNARDAMSGGGKLTIETANTHLDEAYAAGHDEVKPGQYVMVAVTDTGTGMTKDVVAKAFDPFFTTKDVGQGTGLGLSQVYGFVKQSDGHVKIYSEPGEGTTIRLYLPRLTGGADDVAEAAPAHRLAVGQKSETILVVEDDADVRAGTVDMLRRLGYRVLEAADGRAALRVLESEAGIDLLFTDVGLPGGLNGRQFAEAALLQRPALKVLFTTGYARNAIVHHGRLDPGLELIVKPFNYAELAAKLRAVLEG